LGRLFVDAILTENERIETTENAPFALVLWPRVQPEALTDLLSASWRHDWTRTTLKVGDTGGMFRTRKSASGKVLTMAGAPEKLPRDTRLIRNTRSKEWF
jgi:hypothetical protein